MTRDEITSAVESHQGMDESHSSAGDRVVWTWYTNHPGATAGRQYFPASTDFYEITCIFDSDGKLREFSDRSYSR